VCNVATARHLDSWDRGSVAGTEATTLEGLRLQLPACQLNHAVPDAFSSLRAPVRWPASCPGSLRGTKEAKTHVRKCGLPMIRMHNTSTVSAQCLLAGGIHTEVVQMILGHASPEITRKVYGHLMKSSAADQVEMASKLITTYRREQSD